MEKDFDRVFKEIQEAKPRVEKLLEVYPKTRESDAVLISYFWFFETKGLDIEDLTLFFKYLRDGKLTSSETIRRNRQIIFSEKPELRGESYINRKRAGINTRENFKNGN